MKKPWSFELPGFCTSNFLGLAPVAALPWVEALPDSDALGLCVREAGVG